MEKIIVIGSLNMDCVFETPFIPRAGETIAGRNLSTLPGGKGANEAYAAEKLGSHVALIGAVGDDSFGETLLENLRSVGVDIEGVSVLKGKATGEAFVNVDPQGENAIVVLAGANGLVDKEMIDQNIHLIEEADIILIQFEIPFETVSYVKDLAADMGKTLILDPAPARTNVPDTFWNGIDYIKPNQRELEVLTGQPVRDQEEIRMAAQVMVEKGVKHVIASMGADGCLLATSTSQMIYPAPSVRAVDTTAAGDCFMAAFAVALSEGKSVEDAIDYAQRAAAISVTRRGAQPSMPSRQEVER